MAPQAKVSVTDAVNAIKKFMLHFTSNALPAYTSEVWKLLSHEVKGHWSAHNFYINVREDRRDVLSLARRELGIVISTHETEPNEVTVNSSNNSNSGSENENEKKSETDYTDNDDPTIMQNFVLLLTPAEWAKIQPSQKSVGKLMLTSWVWTNVISLAFWRQYKLPCAFVYKRADVTAATLPNPTDDEKTEVDNKVMRLPITHFIKINGRCRSRKCGNIFIARAELNLDDEAVIFHIKTRDTTKEQHEEVKRPFNGKYRKEAYNELIAEGATVWRKRQARQNMVVGDIEPPFLPTGKVLRDAKREAIDAVLDVKVYDGRDLIKTIEDMSLKPEFCGLIHAVSALPFHVFYSTPAQLQAYKEYCRLNKHDCSISIDATGSLVQKLKRSDGAKSGHIFLYIIVINFENSTLPVYQMLSEKHETEFIEFWIKKWIRLGAPKPKEAVCDYSRALISALCLAFNNITIKNYVNDCFARLYNPGDQAVEHPSTIIRIDVSHLIHLVCRWKSLKSVTHRQVKNFYVRCVALLVECHSLEEFKNLFILICTVGLQVYEDVDIDKKLTGTAKDARKILENHISTRNIEIESEVSQAYDEVRTSMHDTIDFVEQTTSGKIIGPWIEKLVMKGKGCGCEGADLNPFYLPDFITSLAKLAKEFPLWTGVMVPLKKQHATSSSVEGYFAFLKSQVCKNFRLPIRVDKFLTLQVRDAIGENLLFSSKMARCSAQRFPEPNSPKKVENHTITSNISLDENEAGTDKWVGLAPTTRVQMDDSDLKSHENWRAKASQKNYGDANIFSDEDSFIQPEIQNLSATEALSDHSYAVMEQPQTSTNISSLLGVLGENVSLDCDADGHSSSQYTEVPKMPIVTNLENKAGIAKNSKYFMSFPEIRNMNANVTQKFKKGILLPNGLICSKPVKIDGKLVFLRMTCPFDSLVHILMTSAIDDQHYASILRQSDNPTLQLVSKLITVGSVTKEILENRGTILNRFFAMKCGTQTSDRILSYTLTAEDSMANIVCKLLESDPSVRRRIECFRCGTTERPVICISPNFNVIINQGFCAMEKALAFRHATYKLPCTINSCGGQHTTYNDANYHLFIELDVRGDLTWTKGLPAKLRQLPVMLKLGGTDEYQKEYRITEVVGYEPGHFVAYCRRSSGLWQEYNDLADDISSCDPNKEIVPHLAVYVHNNQQQ